jgi:hypothetical protein
MEDDMLHSETRASDQPVIVRRTVLFGSVALAATSLVPAGLLAQLRTRGVVAQPGGTKPTYLPEPGSRDPVAHSIAENLFWNEQLMEHAVFFGMLMPGPELAAQRARVTRFQTSFAGLLARSRTLTAGNYRAANRATIDQARRFADFKHQMQRQQASGRLKSLVWPTFFDHTAREAEYFADRLTRLNAGNTAVDAGAATRFWARIMGEHADFVAHLLDPEERALVAKAMETSRAFHALHAQPSVPAGAATKAVADIIDFKVAAEKGIQAGTIKSIIHPTLADHVRREALKAADELRRAG